MSDMEPHEDYTRYSPPPGYQWQPPPPPRPMMQQNPQNNDQWGNVGRQAAGGFLQGFTGCLGVGLAIIFVLVMLIVLFGHH